MGIHSATSLLMGEVHATALQLAARLTAQAGLPMPQTATRLSGGKNNRVFRVGDTAVLKIYHWDPRDSRDRLRAEWRFLSYAWARGVRNIPQPLARDDLARAGLYTLLPGHTLVAGNVTSDHIDAALAFMLAVNGAPRDPAALDPGSEACFTLNEHIATVDRRVGRLARLDPGAPHRIAAETLIDTRLRPTWDCVRVALQDGALRLGIGLDCRLDDAALCISPSDFGFHNALADGDRLGFIDFEYAGRDDPAKLVCDFFCQPELPVPLAHMAGFTARLMAGLGLDRSHEARCRLLLDAYRVKWTCIILNDFLPLGAARRIYADLDRTDERCAFQLARAAAKLDEIESS
jgi:Phosphotransferase enzyme family